ncbi:CynX/NimT family MFS transporter [Microbacterium sp.]|jgi:CP family cyanate transporter-like MFS transporter|uniref:CynX/NimT family MFS transporter n=1 Tax=Microbacterium sp. TaxID=51671 RepID=UPI0037C67127|tara:strand:+ start:3178 stop:4455 length:1278 start_codon:yes stop_codon:yes gene_type:complete
MTGPAASSARRAFPWLVVVGILVAALSLRGPMIAPTPVLRDIQDDLGIGAASAGLLTTVPVLMFALLTPVAALVIRRAGAELALLLTLVGVMLGTLVRAIPGFGWMLAGSLVIGAAITVGNVVVPVIIRRDVPPTQVSAVTAAYVAMLNAGSLLTALATAPLAGVLGWPLALLAWIVVTVSGILLWAVHLRRARGADAGYSGEPWAGAANRTQGRASDIETLTGPLPVPGGRRSGILRRPIVWLLAFTFACQAAIYYGLTTWLPTILGDELGVDRTTAGTLASVFQGVAIAGAFVVPLLARRFAPIVPALVICACWLALTVGMLVAPAQFILWASLGAIAHAGGFVVIFSTLVAVARSDAEAAGMSAFVQGAGYTVAALAAPVMGALHEVNDGWTGALVLLLVLSIAYGVLMLAAMSRLPSGRAS